MLLESSVMGRSSVYGCLNEPPCPIQDHRFVILGVEVREVLDLYDRNVDLTILCFATEEMAHFVAGSQNHFWSNSSQLVKEVSLIAY